MLISNYIGILIYDKSICRNKDLSRSTSKFNHIRILCSNLLYSNHILF